MKQQKQQRVSRAIERILHSVCSKHLTALMNEIPAASSSPTPSKTPESEKVPLKRTASNANSDEQSDCEFVHNSSISRRSIFLQQIIIF